MEAKSNVGKINIPYNICKTVTDSGIPLIDFIEDVGQFLKQEATSASSVIEVLNELLREYKLRERTAQTQKASLNVKTGELKEALTLVSLLKKKRGNDEHLKSTFKLGDNIYTDAKVKPENNAVGLWLGANVMLEYDYEDAKTLLNENLEQARTTLGKLDEELDCIKDQIVTTEVSMARLYNYDLRKRQGNAKQS